MDNPYDHLLASLSEKGHGSWMDFRKAISIHELDESPFAIATHLCQLAHMDFDSLSIENTKEWSISTPCLALTVDKPNEARAILCGKRNPTFLASLSEASARNNVRVISAPQEKNRGPSVIILQSVSMDHLNRAATQVGITMVQKPAWKIILSLPELKTLIFTSPLQHPLFGQIHKYDFDHFNWILVPRKVQEEIGDGLYRFGTYEKKHALILNEETWHTEGEAAIWWILAQSDRNVLTWSIGRQELRLPYLANPPILLARSLVLCSGFLPSAKDHLSLYHDINEPLARHIAEWLGQKLEVVND